MQVARQFKTVNFTDLHIAPSALYALASGSTPDFIRGEILEEARATGQPVTNKAVQERLHAHRADLPSVPVEVLPEPQEAPAPAEPANNAEMATKKKDKPVKASEPYVPLPVEYEEREHEDGSVHLYPKLPTTQQQEEIKQRDWSAAANRVKNAAYSAKVALGQLRGYSVEELEQIVESQPGMQLGLATHLRLLRDGITELMEKWDQLTPEARVVDAEPLLEVLPPKEKKKSLSLN